MSQLLIKSITHDLKTPLNAVLTLNSIMELYIRDDSHLLKYVNIQKTSCILMMNIVQDIVDLANIQNGNFEC